MSKEICLNRDVFINKYKDQLDFLSDVIIKIENILFNSNYK